MPINFRPVVVSPAVRRILQLEREEICLGKLRAAIMRAQDAFGDARRADEYRLQLELAQILLNRLIYRH